MPIKCPTGGKARFRFRTTKKGIKQRLAFCGNKVMEIVTFKKGKKKEVKKLR